jgi:hypothetical protein
MCSVQDECLALKVDAVLPEGRVAMEDAEAAKPTAQVWTTDKGIAFFTEGSKLDRVRGRVQRRGRRLAEP